MGSQQDPGGTVSRRNFFKTVGVTSVATSILTGAHAEAQGAGPQVLGPGEVSDPPDGQRSSPRPARGAARHAARRDSRSAQPHR